MEDDEFCLILKINEPKQMDKEMMTFGLICFTIGVIGLLVLLGIIIAAMGIIPVCIYVCLLLIVIGILACNVGSDGKLPKYPFENV